MENKKPFTPLLTSDEEFILSRQRLINRKIDVNTLIIILTQVAIMLVTLVIYISLDKRNSEIKELQHKVRKLELQVNNTEATDSFPGEI